MNFHDAMKKLDECKLVYRRSWGNKVAYLHKFENPDPEGKSYCFPAMIIERTDLHLAIR